jgi:hypothetical protein
LDERNTEEDKTVHWKLTSLWGGKKVELRETQRAVTPFGGMVVFVEFLQQVGYREAVSKYLPFHLAQFDFPAAEIIFRSSSGGPGATFGITRAAVLAQWITYFPT